MVVRQGWKTCRLGPNHIRVPHLSKFNTARGACTLTAMLYWFHASMYGGHLGVGRTQRRVGKFVWWPGLSKDVQAYVGSCWLCAGNRTPSKPRSVRGLLEKPCPMQLVSLDYVGPLQWHGSSRSYLVVIDHSTRFVVGVACSRMDAESTVQLFRERLVSVFQTPRREQYDE